MLRSCDCKWCQRALFGDWERPQQDAFCWSQFFWCNKIKVNPRNSLADSRFKTKQICKFVSPSEDTYKSNFIFFQFPNISVFLTRSKHPSIKLQINHYTINQVYTTFKLHNYIKLQQAKEPWFVLESHFLLSPILIKTELIKKKKDHSLV